MCLGEFYVLAALCQVCHLLLGAVFSGQCGNLQSLCLPLSVFLKSEHIFLD